MYSDDERDDEAKVLAQLREVLEEIEQKSNLKVLINSAFKVVGIIFMLTVIAVILAWVVM